jgi:uncharacterized protein
MRCYLLVLVRYRIAVLAAVALVTAALAAHLGTLRIVVDPDQILPQTHPYLVTNNLVSRLFGNKFVVIVSISARSGTVFQPAVLDRVKRLTDALATMPGVVQGSILSLAARRVKAIKGSADGLDAPPMMERVPTTPDGLARLEAAFDANPVYRHLLVSDDRRSTAVIAEVQKDPGGFRSVVARLRALVDPLRGPQVDIAIGGQPVLVGLIERFSDRMSIFFPIALVIIGILHFEAFRSVQALVLPLVTALLAVVWSLGILSWSGATLDAFNAVTPILILAVAAGHAVQILKRYYERCAELQRAGGEPRAASRQAVIDSLTAVGPVMLAAGLIAVVSFSSLMVFGVRTIQMFGLFTALGIASAVVIELTFTPALRATLPPPSLRTIEREHRDTRWDRMAGWLAHRVVTRPATVAAVAGGVLALLCAAGFFVRVDNDTRAYFFRSVPALREDRLINRRFAGTNTIYVLIEGKRDDAIKDPRVLRAMEATQDYLDHEAPIGKTISIVDFLKRLNQALAGDDPAAYRLPETRDLTAQYLLLYSMSGDPGDFDHYVDYPYRNAVIIAFTRTENSVYLSGLARRLEAFAKAKFPPDVHVRVGGRALEPVALNETIVADKLLNIVQIALFVFVVSSLLFRSVTAGCLVLVPLAATIAAIFGLMGLARIPLQVATATVAALSVGIGADYAIYFLYRVRDVQRQTGELSQAVRMTFASAGKAVIFVATAVAGGYAVLMTSWGFFIHIWLGLLTATAMVVSAAATLTAMPALVLLLRPRFLLAPQPRAKAAVAGAAAAAIVGAAAVAAPARAQDLPPDAVMQRNFIAERFADSVSEATFTLVNGSGQRRIRKAASKTKLEANGVDNMRIVWFLSPPDVRGTATLTIEHSDAEDDIWVYLPALQKTRRLLASNKKDSYVGTDFSYNDIIGFNVRAWRHRLLRREALSGANDYVIVSVPASAAVQAETGISKRVQWIRPDSFVAEKTELYDTSGRLAKTLTASDIRRFDPANSRWQAMHQEAHDALSGHSTVVQYDSFRANTGISADDFNVRALERAP